MDSGIKLIVGFVALVLSIVTWAQFNEEAESISKPTPIIQKLFFEGSIGGKYAMSMSFDRMGDDVTGSVVNTEKNLRTLKGSIGEDKTFLIHEYDGDNGLNADGYRKCALIPLARIQCPGRMTLNK